MPIYINRTAEPLAGGEILTNQPRLTSDAAEILKREIGKYVRKEIRGRSLLIAGHRGAGKTTAVLDAIESVRQRAGTNQPRPILVRVHGPDLLGIGSQNHRRPSNGTSVAFHEQSYSEFLSRHARLQIVLSLLRALCDEAAECYHACVTVDNNRKRTGKTNQELLEAAAQFRLELDREPDEIRLRQYWELIHRLSGGIFSQGQRDDETASSTANDQQKIDCEGRGYREIVALATAIRVHREIRDHLDQERRDSDAKATAGSGRQFDRASSSAEQGGEDRPILAYFSGVFKNSAHVLNPLAGLIVGVILVAMLMKSDVDIVVSLVAGFVAAVGATLILNFASSRGEHYSLMSTSMSDSLNRMLPVLLERVRSAGLHPVFAVDELDKVIGLPRRMKHLMRSLKHIVADQSFFCFLVNREYYELIAVERRTAPYPQVETYFGELLYVYHTPAQMHHYLDKLLDLGEHADELRTKVLFIYMALYQSKMHAGVLSRYINSNLRSGLVDGQPEMRPQLNILAPAPSTVPAYRQKLLVQLAVEFCLEDDEVKSRLRQSPDSAQQVYDALYYPARNWDAEHPSLDTSQDTFSDYLKRRTDAKVSRYGETDLQLLRDAMNSVVEILVAPEGLNKAISVRFRETDLHGSICSDNLFIGEITAQSLSKRFKDLNCEGIRLRDRARCHLPSCSESALVLCDIMEAYSLFSTEWDALLRKDPLHAGIFHWNIDRYGRQLDNLLVQQQSEVVQLAIRIQCIQNLVATASLGEVNLELLAVRFNLLDESPTWARVAEAIEIQADPKHAVHHKDALKVIADYYEMLCHHGALLRAGLILAWACGGQRANCIGSGLESDTFRQLEFARLGGRGERLKHIQDVLVKENFSAPSPRAGQAEHLASVPEGSRLDQWIDPLRILLTTEWVR